MLMDLLYQFPIHFAKFLVEPVDFVVETSEWLLIWEFLIEIGDGVEVDIFKVTAHLRSDDINYK